MLRESEARLMAKVVVEKAKIYRPKKAAVKVIRKNTEQ